MGAGLPCEDGPSGACFCGQGQWLGWCGARAVLLQGCVAAKHDDPPAEVDEHSHPHEAPEDLVLASLSHDGCVKEGRGVGSPIDGYES